MTCYFRHLGPVFEAAEIVVTKENRKEFSANFREITCEGDCPAIWRQIKKRLAEDKAGFVAELKTVWANRSKP